MRREFRPARRNRTGALLRLFLFLRAISRTALSPSKPFDSEDADEGRLRSSLRFRCFLPDMGCLFGATRFLPFRRHSPVLRKLAAQPDLLPTRDFSACRGGGCKASLRAVKNISAVLTGIFKLLNFAAVRTHSGHSKKTTNVNFKYKRMHIVRTAEELRAALGNTRGAVGFVPTMGALHAGHISLVERARAENDVVVTSIFVNPNQFNDPADLKNYPRTPERDEEMLRNAGADILFAPGIEDVYPEPDTRQFDFGQTDKVMEGAARPGHFNGVAQVVSRLFDMVKPRRAYFGEKDFQQIAVINALVEQLGANIDIVECPIVRESDGLAMSSRNTLLDEEHRAAAPLIYKALSGAARSCGIMSVAETEDAVRRDIEKSPLLKVIYFCIADEKTLQPVGDWQGGVPLRGFIAVQAGAVRLIDNIKLEPKGVGV